MPTPKRTANSAAKVKAEVSIENLTLIDVGVTAEESSLIAKAGLKPDNGKAYVEFDICHSLPEVAGPVQSGNYLGYTADTLEKSHASLVHQQFNIRHLLRAYSGADGESQIAKDRIIGCVVATSFPKRPPGGWIAGQSVPIRAAATIFKLADGVGRLLGDHLTSRKKQSVSIETITPFGNIGVHRPSTGEIHPILNLPDDYLNALSEVKDTNMPHVGKIKGEQLVVIYGIGEPILLRGVGMTDNPAERAARIVGVAAEKREFDAETMMLATAEQQSMDMIGLEVTFQSKRVGRVVDVTLEGKAKLGALALVATKTDPVLKIRFPDGALVLRRCSEVVK